MLFGDIRMRGDDKRRETAMLMVCMALAIVAIVLLAIGLDMQSQGIGNALAAMSNTFGQPDVSPTPSITAPLQRGRVPAPPNLSLPHGPVGIGPGDWITSDDYPSIALERELQGRVRIELSVASSGKVTGCRILETSYVPLLDEAACPAARRRARFDPARDPDGRPIPSAWQRNVVWMLPSYIEMGFRDATCWTRAW